MATGAACHSRVGSQANTSARSGIVAPLGYKVEALTDWERLPLLLRFLQPIAVILDVDLRVVLGKARQESRYIRVLIKEGAQRIRRFGDSGGARFPKVRNHLIPAVVRNVENNRSHP